MAIKLAKKGRKVGALGESSFNLRSGKMVILIMAVVAVVLFVGVLQLVLSMVQQTTYYVLNQDVPTRTLITPEMLKPVVTSEGTAPPNAKSISDIQSGYAYTRYPLSEGDVLSDTNVGGFDDIATGVPDSWVVTSFGVGADDAVGGRITRGTYFDLMITTSNGSAYPFVNMLALDTSVSLSGASSSNAVNTEEAKSGQTSQYTVGMSPADAARLHTIVKKYGGSLKLVLSPRENQYKAPALSKYTGTFDYTLGTAPSNQGKNTDYTFTPLKRDAFGRPLANTEVNCGTGNGKVTGDDCKSTANPSPSASASPSPSGN